MRHSTAVFLDPLEAPWVVSDNKMYLSTLYIISYFFTFVKYYLRFLAVFAAFLKAEDLGAPLDPGLRIVSPEPALIRLRLAWMLLYSPLGIISLPFSSF